MSVRPSGASLIWGTTGRFACGEGGRVSMGEGRWREEGVGMHRAVHATRLLCAWDTPRNTKFWKTQAGHTLGIRRHQHNTASKQPARGGYFFVYPQGLRAKPTHPPATVVKSASTSPRLYSHPAEESQRPIVHGRQPKKPNKTNRRACIFE